MKNFATSILKAFFNHFGTAMQSRVSTAHALLERADTAAGRDPQHAVELRRAAMAYLGVVR